MSPLSGHVNDTARMVPPQVRDRLEHRLAAFEHDTGAQIAVLTVASLDGEVLESYAIKVAQTWRLGRKGVDDGVLLLIARDDRKLRIEVGYGLEAKLTDVRCRRIEDDVILPGRSRSACQEIWIHVDINIPHSIQSRFAAADYLTLLRHFFGQRIRIDFDHCE